MVTSSPRPSRKAPPLTVDALWQLERVGAPSLAPDGRQLVCTLTKHSMADNRARSQLWLLPTQGRARARALTACGDKDGQPAWSPKGERIAFLARREQEGERDSTPQLYLIAPDGGEAQRASRFAPGIEAFKWLPDGRGIVFSAWVWPELKGAAAQSRRFKAYAERKETGYATSEAYYRHWDHNLPEGRVLHLLRLDLPSGRITDLFEGTGLELPRDGEAGATAWDIHPSGQRIAFQHDPAARKRPSNRLAVAELDLRTRRVRALADDPQWDFGAPSYHPDGHSLALCAAQTGRSHKALNELALVEGLDGRRPSWRVLTARDWDHDVEAPLRWTDAGQALLFAAEQRGRRLLWRHTLATAQTAALHAEGWVQAFACAGDTLVLAADSAQHPTRLLARSLAAAGADTPRRLERWNDALLARHHLGAVQEQTIAGARGEPVQCWITYPVDFDPKRRHPVLHVIHGGPYAAAGDSFNFRWNPHLLASRGHVVVQVNYHGSSGFGFAFRDSIMGRQGELELQDLEAVTDWLQRQPWVDGDRISASGGSYGGFLVAWMNGHVQTPGRYCSYVCHAGVFDRVATFAADSYMERPRDLHARYWEDPARVAAQSPHSAAQHFQTPTLVIHGARDYRVPDCNGLAYYNTLQARGIEARLLWFPDENHWVLKPRNSKLWYQEFLDWVERHDLPAKPKQKKT
ncbi:MAG: S9 family peptidase [Inhella sp.]